VVSMKTVLVGRRRTAQSAGTVAWDRGSVRVAEGCPGKPCGVAWGGQRGRSSRQPAGAER